LFFLLPRDRDLSLVLTSFFGFLLVLHRKMLLEVLLLISRCPPFVITNSLNFNLLLLELGPSIFLAVLPLRIKIRTISFNRIGNYFPVIDFIRICTYPHIHVLLELPKRREMSTSWSLYTTKSKQALSQLPKLRNGKILREKGQVLLQHVILLQEPEVVQLGFSSTRYSPVRPWAAPGDREHKLIHPSEHRLFLVRAHGSAPARNRERTLQLIQRHKHSLFLNRARWSAPTKTRERALQVTHPNKHRLFQVRVRGSAPTRTQVGSLHFVHLGKR